MDVFDAGLYAALALAGLGIGYKALRGLSAHAGPGGAPGAAARLAACLRALPGALRPARLGARACALAWDALLQGRVARNGALRWVMHLLIFGGFMGLLVMHAMDGVTSERWFTGYAPALDPYQWLRNLFGLAALAGLAIAAWRRLALPLARRTTRAQDWGLIALIAVIMLSGFLLESAKMLSPHVYARMITDYSPTDDPEELAALRLYWSEKWGVAFPTAPTGGADILALGREVHESSCAACHSPAGSAFVSRPLALALSPAAGALASSRADLWLYWLHVAACFLGLALLPWAKFLHPLSAPLNLLVRAGRKDSAHGEGAAALTAARRPLGWEACTHCGACSERCSVAPSFTALDNDYVLPSEKLAGLRRFASGGLSGPALAAFAEGSHICTECLRCTEVCPSGIDLQDLWLASKAALRGAGHGGPQAELQGMSMAARTALLSALPPAPEEASRPVRLWDSRDSFWGCIQCTTCTSVCPVVAASASPAGELHLMPQQVMNMLRMGLVEEAMASDMVWSCVTCYKCQEHCPQGVRVADVLYELRNLACGRMRGQGALGGSK